MNKPHASKGLIALIFLMLTMATGSFAFYLYSTNQNKMMEAKEAEIAVLKKMQDDLKSQVSTIETQQKSLIDENLTLKKETEKFVNEKNTILNQVRSSVASFESFRKESADEIEKLKASMTSLEGQRKELADKLKNTQEYSQAQRERFLSEVGALSQRIRDHKQMEAELAENLEMKDKSKILRETSKLHYNLGNFYFRNQNYKRAAAEYKKAVFYEPLDPDAHFNLALVSDDYLDDRAQAIKHFKKFLEIKPSSGERTKVQRRILDLENRDKVLDETPKAKKQEVFKEKKSVLSKFNLAGDKR